MQKLIQKYKLLRAVHTPERGCSATLKEKPSEVAASRDSRRQKEIKFKN